MLKVKTGAKTGKLFQYRMESANMFPVFFNLAAGNQAACFSRIYSNICTLIRFVYDLVSNNCYFNGCRRGVGVQGSE
jgi:hypothetical protein